MSTVSTELREGKGVSGYTCLLRIQGCRACVMHMSADVIGGRLHGSVGTLLC